MVSLEDAVIARLEAGGHRFEILIDPNEAQAFKEGDEIDWEDSIAVDGIWADSAKGCLLYTSPSPRDRTRSRMPSSA